MSTMYPTDPPKYDVGENDYTFEPQIGSEQRFTEQADNHIRKLFDEEIEDYRTEVIGLHERVEELERQVNAPREATLTPMDKADSLVKHLASTGVIQNFKYVDGNRHLDVILRELCDLFKKYDREAP